MSTQSQSYQSQECQCTGIGGATVHLLEGPAMAHLHQHDKFFIDKYKYSTSTRPSRRGVPRGGTRPARRGICRRPRGGLSSLQDSRASFITKEPLASKGETWPPHIQAALHHRGSTACKGDNRHLYGGTIVFLFYSRGQVFFLLSTPVATPPSSLS